MFRKLYVVLYLIDAYFLTLPSMFLVFSVGSVPSASLCFVPYRCLFSHSLTLYFPCVFSGQFSFHLCIVLSFSNVFNEQYVFLKSSNFLFILCMFFSHHYLVSPSFSVGSVPVESPCIFLVLSVGSAPAASLCHLPYRCLFSHHGVGAGRLSS